MKECPKCGSELEHPEARFCQECGAPVPTDESPPTCEQPQAQAEQESQYEDALRGAWADGTLDERDRKALDELREKLGLTQTDAANLEQQARERMSAPTQEDTFAEQASHVTLEINDSHFYMEKLDGVLDFRAANRTGLPIKDICIWVKGNCLESAERCELSLGSNQSRPHMIQIRPSGAGESLITLSVHYTYQGVIYGFYAQKSFKVFAEDVTPENLTIYFDQSVSVGGDMMSNSLRNEAKAALEKGLIKTVNDLIKQPFTPSWQEVPLYCDERLTQKLRDADPKAIRIASGFTAPHMPLEKGCLFLGEKSVPQRALLLGLPQVRLGRDRHKNDVLLRVMPRSHENDSLTKRISRAHITLGLRPDGLVLADLDSAGGTELNGKPVKGEVLLSLEEPSDICVAGVIQLRLRPILDTDPADRVDPEQYTALGSPDDLWRAAAVLKLRSLVIERTNNLAEEEKYIIVFRWMKVGRAADCELLIPEQDIALNHFRILRLGGGFWLESLVDGRVTANGFNVGRGCACPLAPDTKLQFGEVATEFRSFEQCGIQPG